MAQLLSEKLTSGDLWKRFLYMVLFAIAYAVAELVYTVVVIFQFLAILFTGHATIPVLKFGKNLSVYFAQIIRFQTFNTEDKPFPFSDWPDEETEPNQWTEAPEDSNEDSVVEEEPPAPETEVESGSTTESKSPEDDDDKES